MTGLTAWIGIRDIGKPQPGETVVVSAAAGAVGSVAGQLAKSDGARVVGIAGGPDKCALLTDQLGFDAAVDHRAEDWAAQLAAATPNGIDVDFENVGGDIMDAIFARLNIGARVALCGLISGYNSTDPPPGPRAFANLLIQRATLQGFIVLDHFGRAAEAIGEIAGLIAEGRLTPSRPSSRASSSCRRRSICCSTARTSASSSSRRPASRSSGDHSPTSTRRAATAAPRDPVVPHPWPAALRRCGHDGPRRRHRLHRRCHHGQGCAAGV